MRHRFYNQNIDVPLSLANNTDQWDSSVIGKLYRQTNGAIFIREIQGKGLKAEYGWRVVDAKFSQEDSTMTYFHAYGLSGEFLGNAVFGVSWGSVESEITGGFEYPPEFGRRCYVPVQNAFPTPNAGGYTVQVLDMNWPSEGLGFGMLKQGKQHQSLIVSFRLFALGQNYPNDLMMQVR